MKWMFVLITALLVIGCGGKAEETVEETIEETEISGKMINGWESFGKEIEAVEAVDVSEAVSLFEEDEKPFKITGTLTEVCQKKGCWTILKTADDQNVRMTFENYGFFLPKDAAGRKIIAEGVGFLKTTSVEELRHFAEDGGATEEELLAINEPKVEYQFEATGVLLQ